MTATHMALFKLAQFSWTRTASILWMFLFRKFKIRYFVPSFGVSLHSRVKFTKIAANHTNCSCFKGFSNSPNFVNFLILVDFEFYQKIWERYLALYSLTLKVRQPS
jgi:hypothetical protein